MNDSNSFHTDEPRRRLASVITTGPIGSNQKHTSICDKCHRQESTVHLLDHTIGSPSESHYCEECAKQIDCNSEPTTPALITSHLSQFIIVNDCLKNEPVPSKMTIEDQKMARDLALSNANEDKVETYAKDRHNAHDNNGTHLAELEALVPTTKALVKAAKGRITDKQEVLNRTAATIACQETNKEEAEMQVNGQSNIQDARPNQVESGISETLATKPVLTQPPVADNRNLPNQSAWTIASVPKDEYRLKWWDWLAVCFFSTWAIVSIVVGLNNIAVILVNSGQPGFDEYYKAALFSLVSIGIAFGLKIIYNRIKHLKAKEWFAYSTLIVGVVLSGIWVYLFSKLFSGLGTSVQDMVNSVAQSLENGSEVTAPVKSFYSTYMILVGVLAEAIIAAGSSMEVSRILARHKPVLYKENPHKKAHARDVAQLIEDTQRLEALLGRLKGRIEEYKSTERLFVTEFITLFRKYRGQI